ncbi:MAG: DMT family transporter [Gemmataceae bacterium]|nr:DMT family transporter [Gemmataceae bacterium]
MPRWLVWTAAAVVSWGVWAVLGKALGESLSPVQTQGLSTVGLIPVLVALGFSKNRTARPGGRRGVFVALAAGAVSGLGNVPYFDLLARGGPAAAVVPLTALYPVVTIALAGVFLRERVNRVQAAGLGLSLVAIYLFNVPEEGGLSPGWLAYALIPMALWGAAGFLSKLATADLSGELAALLVLVGFLIVNAGLLVAEPPPADAPARTWALAAALGFFLAFGNLAVVVAYGSGGKASVITPLAGLYPVVSVPLAVLAFGEEVGPRAWAGIGCAVAAVLALSFETPAAPAEPVGTAGPR